MMQTLDKSLQMKDTAIICLGLIVWVIAVDCFVFPILPNIRQYGSRYMSPELLYSGFGGSLDRNDEPGRGCQGSPPDNQGGGSSGISYRNASWRAGVGNFLSACTASPLISVSEHFPSYYCNASCGGRGVCNHDLAECRCFHGFSGAGCEMEEEFPCTVADDIWRVSSCGASCDTSKAFCYCGEGTKYPRRPVAEACGFISRDGAVDWKTPDPAILWNSSADVGWCNLDASSATSLMKKECFCTYDGSGEALCDLQVESMCINQCSGNGYCRGGFCECVGGWYGIDCSVPSWPDPEIVDLKILPNWILATINMTTSRAGDNQVVRLNVEKRRPLIYVYDLPSKFNSHLLEGRHFRFWCAIRQYDEQNTTMWIDNLYGSEVAVLESLLASSHRTTNPEEADYFYVPSFEACARVQADSTPHTDMQKDYMGLRGYFSGAFHKAAYEHIQESYPYWNRSGGRDHIWVFPWDEGACSAPKEIWSSIMLVHWGNTNSKHNCSTTAYEADNWTKIPSEWRGSHPCYDPDKDIVLPAWKKPDPVRIRERLWLRSRRERPTLFYFNGNLGSMYESGRPEAEYSMGLRQRLAEEFGSFPNRNGSLGRQAAPDVTVVSQKSWDYGLELSRSRFCGVFPGDGWSGRIEDSVMHGCIPVIVQDGIQLPYENVLEYNAFAVRINESDLPDLLRILRAINESTVDFMLSSVQKVWQRFTYHNVVKLEAKRQKQLNKEEAPWATAYNDSVNDDAFATLIQVLHFRLHTKSWQRISKPPKLKRS